MKNYIFISCFILCIAIFFSCNTPPKAGKNQSATEVIKSDKEEVEQVQDLITEKYWKLIEVNGKRISSEEKLNMEPHLLLKKAGNSVTGNGGCNAFFGNFELKDGNQIAFLKIGATEMACLEMEIEMQFFEVLNTAEHYTITGDTLALKKAKLAPLAKFEAVDME